MAKVVFGEYAAFVTQGGIRFQKHNKLTAESAIPAEVVVYLKKNLHIKDEPKETKTFPKPTPEETQRLKEESMRVAPGLERSDEEMEAQRIAFEEQAEALTPDDFPTVEQPFTPDEPAPEATPDWEPTLPETPEPDEMSDFMESVSIHTASLEDMASALFERFGIYTVYLGRLPTSSEMNPLTAEPFTKYHLGIAYQAAIRAKTQGLLKVDPAYHRQRMDANQYAHENFRDQFQPLPRHETFDYRTSTEGNRVIPDTEIVHEVGADGKVRAVQRPIPPERRVRGSLNGARSVRHPDEEEPLVQPKIGGAPIIRPDW